MTRRMRDVLAQRVADHFVGRQRELACLLAAVDDVGPLVTHVHGIGGIGKSSLLTMFASHARALGITVVSLDCRTIEPTPRGFLHELGVTIGHDVSTPDDAADYLATLGHRVVLTLDTFEVFRLMDTWLRQVFVPALTDNVRVILVGREPPLTAWWAAPGWEGLFQSIVLEPLNDREAIEVLVRSGTSDADAKRINQFTRGHPLALRLAASAVTDRADLDLNQVAIQRVIEELSRLYLLDIDDPMTRRALEATSVVRRMTLPLLRAMLPEADPQDSFDRLHALPFLEMSREGLHLHDAVQLAVSANLKAVDPARYRALRRAAWACLRDEVRGASATELWRYTADMLYLIENPVVREAFFPSDSHGFAVEPAHSEDTDDIQAIVVANEGPEAAQQILRLWNDAPHVFHVARDRGGAVAGFYCMFEPDEVDEHLLLTDSILVRWLHHMQTNPLPPGQCALFCRRWLGREHGEVPSPVQAACWLDIKRSYMELRPRLRRVYLTVQGLMTYAPIATRLRFQVIPEAEVTLDGTHYHTALLDFGPQSVDGWLAQLVGTELDVEQDERPVVLNMDARHLMVEGTRIPLTKLEFETLRYLHDHDGKAISRDELLDAVWGESFNGVSNVVDVVIKTLRRKLGSHAAVIETVRGTGYRFCQDGHESQRT